MTLLKFTGGQNSITSSIETFGLNSVDSIFLSSATLAEYELQC